MIVVSDASPLIALSSVDRLDLMQLLFDTVTIPVSVRDEVMGSAAKIVVELPSFIRVEPVAAELPVRFLKLNLHAGESEAIALALERNIQGIILHDKEAREIAAELAHLGKAERLSFRGASYNGPNHRTGEFPYRPFGAQPRTIPYRRTLTVIIICSSLRIEPQLDYDPNQRLDTDAESRAFGPTNIRRRLESMGDTWVTDLIHFLNEDGSIAPTEGPARRLAEHLVAIVAMISRPELIPPAEYRVRCRRRPGRKPCTGLIQADLDPKTEDIDWWCPVCGDKGCISNWKGTMWDLTNADQFQ